MLQQIKQGNGTFVLWSSINKEEVVQEIWVHKIGQTNLPVNVNTRVCSNHFVSAAKRLFCPDEYPSLSQTRSVTPRKVPKVQIIPEAISMETSDTSDNNSICLSYLLF